MYQLWSVRIKNKSIARSINCKVELHFIVIGKGIINDDCHRQQLRNGARMLMEIFCNFSTFSSTKSPKHCLDIFPNNQNYFMLISFTGIIFTDVSLIFITVVIIIAYFIPYYFQLSCSILWKKGFVRRSFE